MNRATVFIIVISAALAMLAAGSQAQTDSKIHLTGGKKVRVNPWQVNDGAGYRWDIYNSGLVNSGTNNTYSGAMRLMIFGNEFYGNSDSAVADKDGREIEIGPCDRGNQIRAWRRIYVDTGKNGYCRWIDIFENNSSQDQNVQVEYTNNFGFSCNAVQTTGGKEELAAKDWGLAVGDPEVDRPFVVQFFASSSSKFKPTVNVQDGSQSVSYSFNLDVPAGKTAAICIIQAQRRTQEEAFKMLRQFDLGVELAKAPEDLRKLIVNMTGGGMSVGSLNLPRDANDDLLTLRNGDQLKGTIVNKTFAMDTFYGKIELPAEKVLGVCIPIENENRVQLALTDGQILLGELSSGPLTIQLPNGDKLSPPFSGRNGLQTASYSNKNRKANLLATQPMVVLRDSEQLFFNATGLDLSFKTEYGTLKLHPANLAEISASSQEGGLNRAVFSNGSALSGLIASDELNLPLALGPTMTVRRGAILSIRFPGEATRPEKAADVTLRNEDRIYGRITEDSLTIDTPAGKRRLKTAQIRSIEFTPGLLGYLNVREHSGSIVSGTLENQTIKFKIEPGPEMNVYAGHILNLNNPEPPPQPTASSPASKPADNKDAKKGGNRRNVPEQAPLPPPSEEPPNQIDPPPPPNNITPGPDPDDIRPRPMK